MFFRRGPARYINAPWCYPRTKYLAVITLPAAIFQETTLISGQTLTVNKP